MCLGLRDLTPLFAFIVYTGKLNLGFKCRRTMVRVSRSVIQRQTE